jgi:hypothetical protein
VYAAPTVLPRPVFFVTRVSPEISSGFLGCPANSPSPKDIGGEVSHPRFINATENTDELKRLDKKSMRKRASSQERSATTSRRLFFPNFRD